MPIKKIIVFFITISISSYTNIYCVEKMLNKKSKITVSKVLLFCLVNILVIFNNLQIHLLLILPINFVLMLILNHAFLETRINKLFKYLTMYFIIGLIIDVFLSILLMFFNVDNLIVFNNNFYTKSIYTFVHLLLLISIFSHKKTINLINRIKKYLVMVENEIIVIIIFLFVTGLIVELHLAKNIIFKEYFYSLIIIMFLLFLIVRIIFSNYQKNTLINNLKISEGLNNEYRLLRHNILNDLIHIKVNKSDEIIQETIKKYTKTEKSIINMKNIPKGVKGIIYYKLEEIKEENISVYINNDVNENIYKLIPIKTYKMFCDSLSIILDNAIYASKFSKNKIIYINSYDNKETIIFVVVNSFNNLIDLDSLHNLNYSTKDKTGGLGLYFLNKSNEDSIQIKQSIKEDIFITKILIKTKKKIDK